MKIRPVGDEFFRADRRTDGHDEANNPLSQFCEGTSMRHSMQQTEQASKHSWDMTNNCRTLPVVTWAALLQSKKHKRLHRTFQHCASICLCIESQPYTSIRSTAGTHHLLSPSLSWFYSVQTAVKILLSPHQRHLPLAIQHTELLSNPHLWFSFLVLLSPFLSVFHCSVNPSFLLMLYSFICPLFPFLAIYLPLVPYLPRPLLLWQPTEFV